MAELEDKIKKLLDSPDGMNQILKTAQSIFGDMGTEETNDAPENSDLAQEMLPTVPSANEDNLLEKLDPKVVTAAMRIMSEYRKTDDRRIQLLQALRLYFKDQDQVHITKAIQIVKLSKVAKQAFLSLREEDSFV